MTTGERSVRGETLRGSCLCGAVAYEVSAAFGEIHYCHCANCRKAHGSAHATYAAAARSGFRYTRGAERVRRFRSSPPCQRGFCGECGSNLEYLHETAPDTVWIPLGTLDDDPGVRPAAHIFVGSKATWHEITDALARHDGHLENGD